MSRFKDLIGQKFGRLTVLSYYGKNKSRNSLWVCQCECGNITKPIINSHLTRGDVRSCGCLEKENWDRIHRDKKKYNDYDILGNVVKVYFNSNEEYFLCDIDIWQKENINQTCWVKAPTGYVVGRDITTGENVLFHRYIYSFSDESHLVDHINGNRLDNRKCNLREVTDYENAWNISIKNNNISGHTGVQETEDGTWLARITVKGEDIRLGTFRCKTDAILAREEAEIRYYGEYSPLLSRNGYKQISLEQILKEILENN